MKALKCRECGREYPLTATHVCEFDFGPLEVAYDYERIKKSLTREAIASRPKTMWRYRELLPIAGEPTVGAQVGSGWVIQDGLQPGDRIVVEGTQKVKEGSAVTPVPYEEPTNNAAGQ